MYYDMEVELIHYRDVAQVVERYFREVEAASSSLVIPMKKTLFLQGFFIFQKYLELVRILYNHK